ncbi:MAG: hypothetical protein J6M93_04470 [Succinivibrio sp.]|nr:hypothetical protein [Succinivibrio sp.]
MVAKLILAGILFFVAFFTYLGIRRLFSILIGKKSCNCSSGKMLQKCSNGKCRH